MDGRVDVGIDDGLADEATKPVGVWTTRKPVAVRSARLLGRTVNVTGVRPAYPTVKGVAVLITPFQLATVAGVSVRMPDTPPILAGTRTVDVPPMYGRFKPTPGTGGADTDRPAERPAEMETLAAGMPEGPEALAVGGPEGGPEGPDAEALNKPEGADRGRLEEPEAPAAGTLMEPEGPATERPEDAEAPAVPALKDAEAPTVLRPERDAGTVWIMIVPRVWVPVGTIVYVVGNRPAIVYVFTGSIGPV